MLAHLGLDRYCVTTHTTETSCMATDSGAQTSTNYRFQYLYTGLLAMQMYNKKSDFIRLVCEYDDDIVAEDKTGALTAYQITRSDTINSIPQAKVVHSMKHFLQLCKDKNRRFIKFCLLSNQKISDIAEKTNEMKFLNEEQITRYSTKLSIDINEMHRDCLGKIAFMVIQDSLGLEYLIEKEIIAFDRNLTPEKIDCIKEKLINLVQRCSRASYKEDSHYYTCVDENSSKEFKKANSTITPDDISELVDGCSHVSIPPSETRLTYETQLKEHDDGLILQCINEAEETDENIALTALFLERLGRDMKIYNSNRLLDFLKKSIYDNKKIDHLSLYLDIIKRMLHTSVTVENSHEFQFFVKENMKQKLLDIITSPDEKYDRSKLDAFQIIEDYDIIRAKDRNEMYIQSLLNCVQNCDNKEFERTQGYLVNRIPYNTQNVALIRKGLIQIKKSNDVKEIQNRCNSLLEYYK